MFLGLDILRLMIYSLDLSIETVSHCNFELQITHIDQHCQHKHLFSI